MDIPEKRETGGKAVDIEPAGDAAFDVRKPVRQREGELLRRGGTGFANVITGDRNRIPERRMLRAPLEHVDDDFERGLDRIDPGMLGHVFLEDVVLDRAAQFRDRDALLFGGRHIKAKEDGGRAVDRHGRGDLVERYASEQRFHVRERRDRDAALADFAFGARMVGVVAHQRREVECDGEARLAVLEQEFVTAVRVARAAEAGELPHRPQLAAVPCRMDAARERILTGATELTRAVEAVEIGRRIERFFLHGHFPFLTRCSTSAATS